MTWLGRKVTMPLSRVGAMICCLSTAAVANAAEEIRYVCLVNNGVRAGELVVEHRNDGVTHVHYSYQNNVERPELEEEFRLRPDGTYSEYRVKGTSSYGLAVDEEFTRTGDRAVWKSSSEHGEKTAPDGALYVPINGTLEAKSVAIAAAASHPDGRLSLIPAGTLTQRKLDEVDVTGGGKSMRVQLLAQIGLGFSPDFYWATSEAKPRLFASLYLGFRDTIEEGFESSISLLEERQRVAEATLLKELASRLMKPMPGLTVIRSARVFDSESAKLTPASDVYVLRGRITAVLPSGAPMRGVNNEIEAGGRVLLPGLFDMHTHNDRWDGGLQLAAGVTTVRDMGGDNTTVQQRIDEVTAGQALAPQIVPAGLLEGESPYSWRSGFVISNLSQAKEAVDWYAEHGYPQLKIYNSFPKAILRETVAYAHSRGMRVSGHVPAFLRAQDVVEAGFDEIQHITHVLLNFLVTPGVDTRTTVRFNLPAEKVATLDFDSKPVQEFIVLLKTHRTVIDPTLTTFDFLRQRDGEMSKAYGSIAAHMPLNVQRGFRVGSMKIPDDATAARYDKSYQKMIEFVGRMYHAGIPIVAGTDEFAGFALQRELELYVQAGMTPSQVLQIATWNGAKYTRTLADRGSIAPGKRADLTLIDGDPTVDVTNLRKVALVITQGKLVSPRDIDEALSIEPFVEGGPVMRAVPDKNKWTIPIPASRN
jgi:hypothetical protein